jgi:copper transport protein
VNHARRVALAALLALSALWIGSASVAAHALLLSSDPASNAVVATAPTSVTLRFTEPPDVRLSSVRVLDVSGAGHTTGPAVTGSGGPTTLTVPVGPLPDGVYTVAWRTVSSADGHATAGSFAFSVGTSAVPPGATGAAEADAAGSSTVSPASVLVRTIVYLALVVLLGSLLTGEMVLGERARRVRGVRAAAWAASVIGVAALVATQALDAGVAIGDALASSLGVEAAGRLVPLLLAGLALLAGARSPRHRRTAHLAAAALVAISILADAAASHAAAAVAPPLNIGLQWLHAVGVSVWLGGLAGLLLELRDPDLVGRGRLVSSFSRWATAGVLVVAVTGVVRAAFELHGPGELVTTDYGRLLLVKAALFAGLAALGAVNHFRNVPGGEARLAAVRRLGALELLLGATAVSVASLLVTTPPPADLATGAGAVAPGPSATPAPPIGATFRGADFGTTVKVALTVTPTAPGPAVYAAQVVDYDTGAVVAATGVKLRFALPSRPDVGASTLALQPSASGGWEASGSNLSLAGMWTVTAVVAEPTTTVEVPLVVTAAPSTGPPDVNRLAGQPTLYTVHLAGGSQAQLYLDPFQPDLADLHVTYFDASGKELPVNDIAVTAAQGGSGPTALPMSPIEPGHATAKVPISPGVPIDLFVSGTAAGGSKIAFGLTVTPDP